MGKRREEKGRILSAYCPAEANALRQSSNQMKFLSLPRAGGCAEVLKLSTNVKPFRHAAVAGSFLKITPPHPWYYTIAG